MTLPIQRLDPGPRMAEAAVFNGLVFLAGQVAETHAGTDVATQTQECLDRIDTLLARVGSSKARVLSVTIYLADMADYDAFNAVWDRWVPEGQTPARACVQARLAGDEFNVEVCAIAAAG